jgi:hypothetical protein
MNFDIGGPSRSLLCQQILADRLDHVDRFRRHFSIQLLGFDLDLRFVRRDLGANVGEGFRVGRSTRAAERLAGFV